MALPPVFDPLVNAPKPQKLVAGVFGLVVIGAAAYFLLLSPLEGRVSALRAQSTSLERELVQSRAIAADLARFRQEAARLEAQLNLLKDRLPTEKETPTLYRALSDAATQAGLGVSLFQPRGPSTKDYYNEIPITLTAEGTYHELGEFFESVAKLPRVVNVTEFRLSGLTKQQNPLRAEMTLATYTYRPVGSPPAPKAPGAKK
ncbi:MAG: type 4a pilus biogenesis protein PilO [Candidatus Rokubacteria bacterium]|nr:type 4a pilus biogenesis protein PilO [Candidatus Rokubacteria bacterium]